MFWGQLEHWCRKDRWGRMIVRGVCQQVWEQRMPYADYKGEPEWAVRFVPMLFPGCDDKFFDGSAHALPNLGVPLINRDARMDPHVPRGWTQDVNGVWKRVPTRAQQRGAKEYTEVYKAQLRAEDVCENRFLRYNGMNTLNRQFFFFDLVTTAKRFECRNCRLLKYQNGDGIEKVGSVMRFLVPYAPFLKQQQVISLNIKRYPDDMADWVKYHGGVRELWD